MRYLYKRELARENLAAFINWGRSEKRKIARRKRFKVILSRMGFKIRSV